MRECVRFATILAFVICGLATVADDSVVLDAILAKTSEYCDRLDGVSLNFACHEKVVEGFPNGRGHIWLYDYQLIRQSGQTRETRTLLEQDNRKVHVADATLATHRFSHKYVLFGPLGLFGKEQQTANSYTITKKNRWKGRQVFAVEVRPRDGSFAHPKHLYGKALVEAGNYAVLRIDWNESSVENVEQLKEMARAKGLDVRLSAFSEYGVEKNGIRFPSHYEILEEISTKRHNGGWVVNSITEVTYSDYQFFTVDTETHFGPIEDNPH